MFGISWTEFLVILLVAVCVVPVKNWPDVARFFARVFKYIRELVWRATDFSEQVQRRLDLEKPIDDLLENASNDMLYDIQEKIRKKKKLNKKKSVRKK